MKRQNSSRRKGAVLLLILGLMAMFAISILTYMVVTSNMAETAVNSAKVDAIVEIPAKEDVDLALKNIILGSDNVRNPIGPFGILENMYGDWKEYSGYFENSDTEFEAYVNIFPDSGCAVIVPRTDLNGNMLELIDDANARKAVMSLFNDSGAVLTFKGWDGDNNGLWRSYVDGTSAFVLDKVITNPSNLSYPGAPGDYWLKYYSMEGTVVGDATKLRQCDLWHFKVELTDDLKHFVDEYCKYSGVGNINSCFNENQPVIKVRLNHPVYSGTGAGGFTPGEVKDATIPPEMLATGSPSWLRIPFAFWGNAAAPDLRPFQRKPGEKLDFRTFWAHLMDVNYDANLPDATSGLRYVAEVSGGWQSYNGIMDGDGHFDENGNPVLHPIRMNPAYTAPDHRSLFLAHYQGPVTINRILFATEHERSKIVPSFHRPKHFEELLEYKDFLGGNLLDTYRGVYLSKGVNSEAWVTALIRKLTPRPLPSDHWNFTGGNDYLTNPAPQTPLPLDQVVARLGDDSKPESIRKDWDVDNDGDGVREGIWVPSGLPIRVDKNGKAYATMFSYTVLDLDGRINVNTAGNWDQLPNNMLTNIDRWGSGGEHYLDSAQPYSYVDELEVLWETLPTSPSAEQPFFAFDSLKNGIGWRDDSDVKGVKIAVRGDGRGTSNVLLYEALSSIFDVSASPSDITTIASNLLWRRNLSMTHSSGIVDKSGLVWTDTKMDSQPGSNDLNRLGGDDDSIGTRAAFFRYIDPVCLERNAYENHKFKPKGDTSATLGEAKMVYPYRGKTTLSMGHLVSSAVYDYANTAFRSYDPLGAQVYTYAPRYSDNPYLAYQNLVTLQDSPYSLPMLDRLLRPWDSDANALPTQLVDDLRLNVDLYGNNVTEDERAIARQTLTTLSSDVPSPSLVFPNNNELQEGEYRGGRFGFANLIRDCVEQELDKVFVAKGITVHPRNLGAFNNKVDEITAYLAAMLPPEIMAGEKIDLNALAQKNYWLDIDDRNPDLPVTAGDVWEGGDLVPKDRRLHNYGLVKRMERVRGLYIVIMTLLYEDMNADTLYSDPADPARKLDDYIEGSFDLLKYDKGGEELKGLMAKELIATRVAQWCVNTVDFADPDATMTPFFFDPTPFDGWWLCNNDWIDSMLASGDYCWSIPFGGANPEPTLPFLFYPLNGLPSEQMFHFFNDALNVSEAFVPGAHYVGPNGVVNFGGAGGYTPKRSDEYIAEWMSQEIGDLSDQTSDMGFRLCWGMERPDLVLTETLSFHDLGIADTEYASDCVDEHGNKIPDKKVVGGDHSFDQVRRPEGSTYLELYCTANPNVPQSGELYDYKDGMWKLRISKRTPIYTDSEGRELEMPVWRVAIGASTDARGVNVKKSTEGLTPGTSEYVEADAYNNALEKGNKLVYNKRGNSILERLSPTKSGSAADDYTDDISFFSMQPRQFRNYPMPHNAGAPNEVVNIADLDIVQQVKGADGGPVEIDNGKIHGDWKAFNLRSSNILGPAVAAKDDPGVTNEIELDRIVWFTDAQGDSNNDGGTKLGTAGKFPDALRTFANVDPDIQYLAPNQYLVVGPEINRAIGSVAFSSVDPEVDNCRFGVKTPDVNRINLANLGVPNFNPNAKYMVVESNIGNRGLNISEPLWSGTDPSMDPYRLIRGDGKIKVIDPTLKPGASEIPDPLNIAVKCAVMDIPFELPRDWSTGGRADVADVFYDNKIANYPIVQDELFGLGTIPAYKSAFLQRVADPNRPYHPLMNPYITVDWNVMDLTIFTGECMEIGGVDVENANTFTTHADYPFSSDENKIKLAANKALNVDKDDILTYSTDAFSSRQWGNIAQRTFAPGLQGSYYPSIRPNPWARAFKGEGDSAGLQAPVSTPATSPVIQRLPTHTLGMYNDMGPWGSWRADKSGFDEHNTLPGEFKNLNSDYLNSVSSPVYWGAPRVPFEHLVWNDAPYSNPMELALVPASSPGRFGLEFVRSNEEPKPKDKFNLKEESCLSKLYRLDPKRKSSLGSFGVYGFEDWYHGENSQLDGGSEWGKLRGKANVMGPYLNFFASSNNPGETLNLCKALEFVYIPSLFLGTKTLADSDGDIIKDNNGYLLAGSNPEFVSKRREPGKINLNTLTKPAWQAISPNSERMYLDDRLPGAPYGYGEPETPEADPKTRYGDFRRRGYGDDQKRIFQPSHTLGLWAQLDQSKPPVPSNTSLLTQQDTYLFGVGSMEDGPLFNNIKPETQGELRWFNYWYEQDPSDPSSPIITGKTADPSFLDGLPNGAIWREVNLPRNNLYEATAEMQRLSGLTTTRSNVFAVWVTVGYFEVERCNPGVNMPQYDPDGNAITLANLTNSSYKWYQYYQAIYPDGYTYGKELGSDFGETERHRGFSIIDRSVPVDFRRGNSSNYKNSILLQRVID